jgi:hypothetical protein
MNPVRNRGQRMAAACRRNAWAARFMVAFPHNLGPRAGVDKAAGRGGGHPLPGERLAPLFHRAGQGGMA